MIVIDGIIFSLQAQGGISVYFKTLIDYLVASQERFSLMLDESPREWGACSNNLICRQSARFFERYRACRTPVQGSVFHSSYYRKSDAPNINTVVTVHDFIYERFQRGPRKWVHSAQKKAAIRGAQAVICVSESTRQDLLEFVGETPGQEIFVIHNGVANVFSRLTLAPKSTPFLLYVGQRGGYKNFRLVLEAMSFLPEFELHCVGGGAIHGWELAGVPDSVARRVRHLGFVTDEKLNILYNCALCLVYPSSCEGFGIPVVEAMRAGCPVVSTACKAVLEIGGDALTVVYDLDPRAIADGILKTMSSERASLIQKGLNVAQGFSWESTHCQTLKVYRGLGA
ncbi:MAG: glycosyltransferase family 4 protein [Burkholderiales bacterium]|nr:glycosyltransferase family 4 protein [Burkholderiales bacterium]